MSKQVARIASPIGGIAASSRIPTSAEVWYVGADGSVQDLYWYQGGQWQNFTLVEASGPPSASPTRGIAAVSRIPTSMEVWYVGSDGSVQDLYWYQSGQWPNFGGQWKSSRVPGAEVDTSFASQRRTPTAQCGSHGGSSWGPTFRGKRARNGSPGSPCALRS